jgi:hypothetical protein
VTSIGAEFVSCCSYADALAARGKAGPGRVSAWPHPHHGGPSDGVDSVAKDTGRPHEGEMRPLLVCHCIAAPISSLAWD